MRKSTFDVLKETLDSVGKDCAIFGMTNRRIKEIQHKISQCHRSACRYGKKPKKVRKPRHVGKTLELSPIKRRVDGLDRVRGYVAKLGEGWHVPSLWQLVLLYTAREFGHPGLQHVKGNFWSSTVCPEDTEFFWDMNFGDGTIAVTVTNYCDVICVRGSFDELATWVDRVEKEFKNF